MRNKPGGKFPWKVTKLKIRLKGAELERMRGRTEVKQAATEWKADETAGLAVVLPA